MTPLESFRADNPQYDDLDDEQLGSALHKKYYSDIPEKEYRRGMGLPDLEPANEPTVTDRLDNALKSAAEGDAPDQEQPELVEMATPDAAEPSDTGFVNNSVRLAAERGSSLLGRAVRGLVGRPGNALESKWGLGNIVFGTDWGSEDPADGKFRVRYLNPEEFKAFEGRQEVSDVFAETIPDALIDPDLGSEKRYSPESIKEQYHAGNIGGTVGEVIKFGLESGIESTPDMIATLTGLPAFASYIAARSDEIGEARATNKGLSEATITEQMEALPAALGSALFEKIGATKVASTFGSETVEAVGETVIREGFKAAAKRVGKKSAGAATTEAATEAVQEGIIEYLGETLGTDAPLSWDDALERGFFGALAGGTFGGAAGVAGATGSEVTRSLDNSMLDRMEAETNNQPSGATAPDDSTPGPADEPGQVGETSPRGTYFDPRMKREEFRTNLAAMADQLQVGGDIGYIKDDQDNIVGRTKSINPEWFQEIGQSDAALTVKQTRHAVDKALRGERLGVRQARAVQYMLDHVTEQRTMPSNIDYAREELQAARQRRRDAITRDRAELGQEGPPMSAYYTDQAGELYQEAEYLPDMDADARILYELASDLEQSAPDLEQKIKETLIFAPDVNAAITELEQMYDEKGLTPGTQTAQIQPVEQPQTDQANGSELYADQYIDDETGLENEKSFDNTFQPGESVASVNIDSLGAIGDKLGTESSGAAIQAVATALLESGVEVFKAEGDTFLVTGASQAEVKQAVESAAADLETQVLESAKGKVTGIPITAGIAQTKAQAHDRMRSAKQRKEAVGKRAPKGQLPPGAVLASRSVDYGPGSNYVGMLGTSVELPLTPDKEYQLGNGRTVRIPKDHVQRQKAMNLMQKHWGKRIYQGRMKGRTALGYYRVGHGAIRLKSANELQVTAHEFAHWFDDRNPWISRLYEQHKQELLGVSYDSKLLHEGYAEFMRLFLTQEHQARAQAPKFYDAWMSEIENHPEFESALFEVQELLHAWYLQGALGRLRDRFGKVRKPLSEKVAEHTNKFRERALQKVFDGLRPLKEAEKQIRGDLADAAFSGYKSLRLARGAHGVMQGILNRGTVNWNDEGELVFTGKGIKQIFESVSDRMDEIQMYMIARRAKELRAQGRENHVQLDEQEAGLALAEKYTDFETVFAEWQLFNDRMMDFYESSGVISAESREAIQEMNQNYVPFNRIVETVHGEKVKNQGGGPFMRLKGGTHNIDDVFESIVGNTSSLVHMSLINRGKQNFYQMIDNDTTGSAGIFAEKIQKDVAPIKIDSDQVLTATLDAMGISRREYRLAKESGMVSFELAEVMDTLERIEGGLDELVMFWQHGLDPKGSNIDFYYQDGVKQFYEVNDPMILEALDQIGPRAFNLGVAMLGGFANLLRRGVTITPTFQAKNFIRDTMNAFTLSKGARVPAVDATKALLERLYNDEHYWEYMINGGGFASMADADGINRDRVLDTKNKIMRSLDTGLSAFEYANRIAEYKTLRKKGWNARDAALAGREISSDFAMRGSSDLLRLVTISVPFFNARLQGLYRSARELGSLENGKARFAGAQAFSYALRSLGSVTALSMYLYMVNKDDERYQELPDWIRDLSWVIFTGDGEDDYVMIPKPFETGMVWGTIPERIMEAVYAKDGNELGDAMGWMFLQTFGFEAIPQAIRPLYELGINEKFTGAPIVPYYVEQREDWREYGSHTSDAMIALGRKMNISPMKAEHLVRGYMGTWGTYALGVADFMVGDINNSGAKPARTWKDNILISPFVDDGPLRRTHSESHVYDMLRTAREVTATIRDIEKRSPFLLQEYAETPEKQAWLALNGQLKKASKAMSDARKEIDRIRGAKHLDADQKRTRIQAVQRQKNKIARSVHDNINGKQFDELVETISKQQKAKATNRD